MSEDEKPRPKSRARRVREAIGGDRKISLVEGAVCTLLIGAITFAASRIHDFDGHQRESAVVRELVLKDIDALKSRAADIDRRAAVLETQIRNCDCHGVK